MDESTEPIASTVEPTPQPEPAPQPAPQPAPAPQPTPTAVPPASAPAPAPAAAPVAHKPHRSIGGAIGVFFLFGIVALAVRNLLTLFYFDVNPTSGALLTVILALIVAIKWKLEKSKRIGASLVRVAFAGIGWGLILFLFFLNVQLLLHGVVTADQLTAASQAAAASPDAGGAVFGWILKAIAV
ncbi:MAG: hypothetical protein IKD70_06710, partial [Eggerthellaceae bacterium]|nr:hypothetical protein [Eggerthellaceae bacterium]